MPTYHIFASLFFAASCTQVYYCCDVNICWWTVSPASHCAANVLLFITFTYCLHEFFVIVIPAFNLQSSNRSLWPAVWIFCMCNVMWIFSANAHILIQRWADLVWTTNVGENATEKNDYRDINLCMQRSYLLMTVCVMKCGHMFYKLLSHCYCNRKYTLFYFISRL